MAEPQSVADDESPSERDDEQEPQEDATYEQELAAYLQERIKPNLNSGAIPLLARSIAKEIAHRPRPDGAPQDAGADTGGGSSPDFEADMRELQAELGKDWILRFSVQGERGWLTAEKDDGSQRVEAPTAEVLAEAVELLNERGGRAS